MGPDERVFEEARALPAAARAAFLKQACAHDPTMRARVEKLLAGYAEVEQLRPVVGAARDHLTPEEKPSDKIGRYKLLQKIGEGGCGVVWIAEQEEPVRRRVALKVIKLGMDTKGVIARFEAERQALALMEHPNIARVLDAGATESGRPFFVMELVRGVPITRYCDEVSLSTEDRLALFIQVCHAIQHAHERGIIHRDIKPSNILVAQHDHLAVPKVIDFGIAKATQGRLTDATLFTAFEQFIGTPAYMSPEQAEFSGLEVDTRSDVYSLGVLLYELLAGRPPFDPKSLQQAGIDEMRRIIREVEPPRPSTRLSTLTATDRTTIAKLRGAMPTQHSTQLSGDLDWIVMHCLEKDRARRYGTPSDLAGDLHRHLRHEPVVARPPSVAYRLGKFVRRHRVSVAVAAVLTLAAALGITSLWQARRAARAEKVAAKFAVTVTPISPKSIAVLPFENLSGDRKNDYLGEGLSDEVGAAIAGTGQVQVVARSSAYAYQRRSLDVRDMAKQLGVQYLLEGRVHSVEQKTLRVTAELVKVRDGLRVWSKSFSSDVASIQLEIIEAVRRELLPELKNGAPITGPATADNPEAFDRFLRGRHAYGNWSPESLELAINELESATTIEPEFGAAWVLLGEAIITQHDNFRRQMTVPRLDVYPTVLALAERAEQAARPARGEAQALRAHVFIHQLKFREAELASLQAIALSPQSSNAHQWYGHVLHFKGRLAESRRQLNRSLNLELASVGRADLWLITLRTLSIFSGQTQEALTASAQLAVLGTTAIPLHQEIFLQVQQNRVSEARNRLNAIAAKAGDNPGLREPDARWLKIYLEATAGNLAEAHRLRMEAPKDGATVLVQVLACLAVGDPEAALDIIGGAKDEDILGVFYTRHLPEYRQLIGNPRWHALLKRVGLE